LKKATSLLLICFLIFSAKETRAQWSYINAIETSLDQGFSSYEIWLKNNGYLLTHKYDNIAGSKAATLSSVYNVALKVKVYDSKAQPTKIHCYLDPAGVLKNLDIFMVNPKPGEFENIQLVLLKSGFQMLSESRNENEKTTRTYFQKKKIRLNLLAPDDRSYLTISAGTLNNYE